MRVRLTASAASDIRRIIEQIAADEVDRASVISAQFREAMRTIGRAPYLCSPVTRVTVARVRKRSVRPYLVFFEIIGGEILITRVAHERSDWTSLI